MENDAPQGPERAAWSSGDESPAGPIVVGIDGTSLSADALRFGARIACALNTTLEAIAIWQPAPSDLDYPIFLDAEADATEALSAVSHNVFGPVLPSWFSAATYPGDPAQVLIKHSADAEMLIVGTDAGAGLWSRITASISTSCAAHAACPVTVVHRGPRLTTTPSET